jgi:hypothetical protein
MKQSVCDEEAESPEAEEAPSSRSYVSGGGALDDGLRRLTHIVDVTEYKKNVAQGIIARIYVSW